MKTVSLKVYLTRLIWLCVLPLVFLTSYLAIDSVRTLRVQRNKEAADRARDVATAIDRQVGAQIATLQMLAASPLLDDSSRLREFHREAQGFRENFGGHVILADLSLQMLLNTRVLYGSTLPKLPQPRGHAAVPAVLATGRPTVGDMFPGPIAKEPLVAVVVPVGRMGATKFLLLSTIETRQFQQSIDEVTLPSGWSLALLDGKSEVMASRGAAVREGGASVEELSRRFIANSALAPWSVVLEIPRGVYSAPVVSAAVAFAVAILVVTLLSVLVGNHAGQRLGQSVATLTAARSSEGAHPVIAEIEGIRGILAAAEAAREAADAARRESEELFSVTFEQAAVGIAHVAPDGRWLRVNQKLCDIVGYPCEELLTMRFHDITHPDDLEADLDFVRGVLAGEIKTYSMDKRYFRKDRAIVWINLTVSLVRDSLGQPRYFIAVVEDISRRKRAEEHIRNLNRVYVVLSNINQAIVRIRELRVLFDEACRIAVEDGGFRLAWIGLLDEATGNVAPIAHAGVAAGYLDKMHIALSDEARGQGPTASALRQGEHAICNDIERDPRMAPWREDALQRGYRASIALPLMVNGRTRGTFNLYAGTPGLFDEEEVKLLDELAMDISFAMEVAEREEQRRRTGDELSRQQNLLSTIIENTTEAIFAKDQAGRYLTINESGARMLGLTVSEVIGRTDGELLPAETAAEFRKTDEEVMARGRASEREESGVIGGRTRTFLAHKAPWLDNGGAVVGVIGISSDITDRKRIEKALVESEALYRDMFECNPQPMWVYDLETLAFLAVNDAAVAHYQYSRDEFLAMTIRDIRPTEEIPRLLANISRVRGGIDHAGTWLHRKKDGSVIIVEITSHTLDYNGRQAELVLTHDITERLRAQEALAEEESRYRDLVENSNDLICTHDLNGAILSANPAAVKALGYPADQLLRMHLSDILAPGKRDLLALYLRRLRRRGRARGLMFVRTASGEERIWDYDNTLRTEGVPAPVVRGMARDVTEQRQAEERLARSEGEFRRLSQEFQGLLDAVPDTLTLLDASLKILWANQAAAQAIGLPGDAIAGRPCLALRDGRSAACTPCPVERSFASGGPQSEIVTRPDGRIWDIRTVPLVDADGKTSRVIEVKRDITEHRKVEEQLRHAQKLDGIGQLAGGIAHDFNNVLGAVIGFAGLLQLRMPEGDPQRHFVDQIVAAGERAAELTRQILAFSRKQVFDLKPARLNDIVRGLDQMLRRLLPENIDLTQDLAAEDPLVLVDAGQIGQVLLNLVTNARDAIAECGRIGIATGRFTMDRSFVELHGYGEPGEYAMLTVSDTGRGMDAATRARIFEPFFTTKETGKGAGLGLAVVHGIVKQHRGFINVSSEPRKGAVIRVYLPLVAGAVSAATPAKPPARVGGGSETILVAEDDAPLRRLSHTLLAQYGYTVIEAEDGVDAVAKYAANQDAIRLVILDGLMPRKGGLEALCEIRRLCPGTKAIFTSGYADDIFSGGNVRDEMTAFIQKPVMPADLLRTVREVLDRPSDVERA